MLKPVTVIGLGGSLRAASTSRSALQTALTGSAAAGADTRLMWIRDLALPVYVPDQSIPAPVARFVDAVYNADAMIWSTPTYHGSISGSFKNALDWLILLAGRDPPYLTGKPIGLVSTAGGVQGLQAVNSMDFIARALRGWSVPQVLPVAQAWQSFDPEGHLVDEPVSAQLRALGAEVVRAARQFQRDGTCDYAEDRSFMAGERPAPGRPDAGAYPAGAPGP
jgi:FMN reductase